MLKRVAQITIVVALAAAAAANAAPLVRHSGEWETRIDNGQPLLTCYTTDTPFDQNYVMQKMSKIPGGNCKVSDFNTMGSVLSYSVECTVGGAAMTSSGTITVTGPDALSGKVHSHGGVLKMGNGKAMTIPDTDMTETFRRLGPCKPGDRKGD
jgi:hypothetical protein